jgi:hypothetical protein
VSKFYPIPNFPTYYATKAGGIYHLKNHKFVPLKQTPDGEYYHKVSLYRDGKRYKCMVHRTILETFKGMCPKGMVGCHLDGNSYNNKTRNLKWATQKENISHKNKHGTMPLGSKHHNAILHEQDIPKIRLLAKQGMIYKDIAKLYNVSKPTITAIVNKRTWSHI